MFNSHVMHQCAAYNCGGCIPSTKGLQSSSVGVGLDENGCVSHGAITLPLASQGQMPCLSHYFLDQMMQISLFLLSFLPLQSGVLCKIVAAQLQEYRLGLQVKPNLYILTQHLPPASKSLNTFWSRQHFHGQSKRQKSGFETPSQQAGDR